MMRSTEVSRFLRIWFYNVVADRIVAIVTGDRQSRVETNGKWCPKSVDAQIFSTAIPKNGFLIKFWFVNGPRHQGC